MNVSLSTRHVVKRYGGVVALADGNLDVASGEVVALLGANGSGKSTLTKIITGVVSPDGGEILLDGKPVRFNSPQAAMARGVSAVYQELSLVPDMSVEENIWLAHEPLQRGLRVNARAIRRRTLEMLALFAGAHSPRLVPDAPIRTLPPDEKQLVEILKALSLDPRVLILDEATASLDSRQVDRLFELMRAWKQQGKALVFVSHRMDEIFRVADRAVVLRNGATVGDLVVAAAGERDLVQLMVGSAAAPLAAKRAAPARPAAGEPLLRAEKLASDVLAGVSLEVRAGELVGLGGLRGQGQEDILLAAFGAIPFTGRLWVAGAEQHFKHPRQAMRAGFAYVPGERTAEGLLPIRSILDNLQLPSWAKYGFPLRMDEARGDAGRVAAELRLIMESLDAPATSLSGGNAQKVVVGKWLLRSPRLLLLNDPTKGVDVGAKGEIYRLLEGLRAAGTAILFYSSDDEELLGLCDRVLVLHDGAISAELAGDSLTREQLVAAGMGAGQENGV